MKVGARWRLIDATALSPIVSSSRLHLATPNMPPSSPQTLGKLGRAPPRSPGTPRRRKFPHAKRLQGIKPDPYTLAQIKTKLIAKLGLEFVPDDWQIQLISKIRQGYDSVFCAGTGYGKSLVFEGLASLGGKGKVVIVISPLKALERDQVRI